MHPVKLLSTVAAFALCVAPLASADDRLLGTWVGTSASNQGARVTVERGALVVDGQLALSFPGPGSCRSALLARPTASRYEVQGDTLTTVDEDGAATWRREGAAQPRPQPQPQPQPAQRDPFAGTRSGDGLEARLEGSVAQGYRGSLTLKGQRYPLEARVEGGALRGTFQVEGHGFDVAARLEGGLLLLESGGTTYRLRGSAPGRSQPGPRQGGQPAPADGQVILTQHRLKDPGMGNMESHVILAPKGWTVTGGAWWANPQRFFNVLPSHDVRVVAPDGREVHLCPSLIARDFIPAPQLNMARPAEGSSDSGYPVIYLPDSLEAWKAWVAQKAIRDSRQGSSDVRVTNAVMVPELTQILRKQIEWRRQQLEQQAQQDANLGMRTFIDAMVLAFECSYTQQGRAWEELVIFGASWEGFDAQISGRSITWTLNPFVTYRAPQGQLEASMPLLVAIVNSLQPTPQWARMRAEHQATMLGIAAEGARKANEAAMARSRMLSKTNDEINDIIMNGWKNREAIRDETHRKVILGIRGTEDYVGAGSSTPVELPSTYQRVYTNGNGEYLLTNDVLYDPNTDHTFNGQTWTGMQPRR
ncbi:MAG: hypothetical protein R3F62_23505 [Planctomycetota bacterium]